MKRLLFVLIAVLIASPLYAQQTTTTQLRLVIIDQLQAGIPAATVTIKREGAEPITFTSDDRGLAISPPLAPGPVIVQVEFPGFEPFEAPLTLRRGAMNETVTLRIEGFKEEVQVTDTDAPEASRATSTTTLSQEEIEALPDDPDELEEALLALAGPGGATFMMNGFSGGRLPNRDQIRSIRFRQNNYAADNHDAGRAQIEIVTRPNTNWGGTVSSTYGGDALNARHPQQMVETPRQERQVQFNVRGPVVRGRTSFNFNANGRNDYSTQPLIAIDEFGNSVGESAQQRTTGNGFTLGFEHSLTQNQGVYFNFQRSETENLNQGVGGFSLPERARNGFNDSNQLRFRLQGLVGQSSINEFRVQVIRQGSETTSLSRAPAVIVQDAFSRGGAGQFSNNSTERVEIAENFDFNWGRNHAMRVGVLVDHGRYRFFSESNQAGTWTYRNIDDFRAGLPQQFSQQLGVIDTRVTQTQLGFFWSDEFRVHRDFALGVGVRNEMQSRIDDKWNLMPRLGFTWAPFGSQRSAIRGGYGLFYDWYEANLYDRTLRYNGTNVKDIRITCSELNGYCSGIDVNDPLSPGLRSSVSGRTQAHPDLEMPRVHQASISYDRQLNPNMTLQTSYQMLRGRHQFRARNLNVPVAGVRPNPAFGDITQFESTGKSQSDRFNVGLQMRVPSRQMMVRVQYTLGQEKNHGSATSLPSDNNNPDVDWGPAGQDIRHRVQLNGQLPQFYGVRINLNGTIQSGGAYNWTTGLDDNDDGVFNDRPIIDGARVTRNSLRGDPTWSLNMNLNKRFNLGGLRTPAQPGRAQQGGALFQRGGGGGGGQGGFAGGGNRGNQGGNNNSRFGIELQVQAQNILNHVTKTGYTGNMSSPFFRTATGVNGGRDINVSLRFQF